MKKIFVTKPYLPPINDFYTRLPEIWKSRILSNNGPMVSELESALSKYLGVKHISLVSNATIGLMLSLKASNIKGEVITSPFSFVATAQAIEWNGLKPVFVDIEKDSLNIDPNKILNAITDKTSAILPIHCYGNVCNVKSIAKIARDNSLKVIYDAAHSFAAEDSFGSTLSYGDFSVVSFHATKVFNTFEGGAIISNNIKNKERVDKLINFSLNHTKDNVDMLGLNGKMSEISALSGLCQLKYIEEVIEKRKTIYNKYCDALSNIKGINVVEINNDFKNGYSYMPILITEDYKYTRDYFHEHLEKNGIFSRKYFHPLITDLSLYKSSVDEIKEFKYASKASEQILCLPIYPELSDEDFSYIVNVIKELE